MPLEKGKGAKKRAKNIKELMDGFKKTGKIGNSSPKDKTAAVKQAVAIAYKEQRKKK